MNRGMNATIRLRSSALTSRDVRMTTKYAIAATMVTPMTQSARLDALMTPVRTSTTITTMPAAPIPNISG